MFTNPPEEESAVHQLRMIVTGRVQGVGFRAWARQEAVRLHVSGSVRNNPDGSVEVLARGTAAALDRFHQLLQRGPLPARVEHVSREPTHEVTERSFHIVG